MKTQNRFADLTLLHRVQDAVTQLEYVDLPDPSKTRCDNFNCAFYGYFNRCYLKDQGIRDLCTDYKDPFEEIE